MSSLALLTVQDSAPIWLQKTRGWMAGPFSELGELAGRFAGHGGMMKVVFEGIWTSDRALMGS